jgi:hypothetical protein
MLQWLALASAVFALTILVRIARAMTRRARGIDVGTVSDDWIAKHRTTTRSW